MAVFMTKCSKMAWGGGAPLSGVISSDRECSDELVPIAGGLVTCHSHGADDDGAMKLVSEGT